MAKGQRQLLHGSRDQELCQAIGAHTNDHTGNKPAKQGHVRELCKNIETGLRQTGRTAGLTNGDGATAQMVR